jgi:hypothetical protein
MTPLGELVEGVPHGGYDSSKAHVGFQGHGFEDVVNSAHPIFRPLTGVRPCRSISRI